MKEWIEFKGCDKGVFRMKTSAIIGYHFKPGADVLNVYVGGGDMLRIEFDLALEASKAKNELEDALK